ncbi:serine hydrolase [Bacillus sp. 03113]|uniref:serine hydrolase domain-containing protein n=1 Tax=Bacillus sp. 03113 TaxID=2578211 RepID=UPI0011445163|nr:serine hydrolase domain-containing protein [Bacillus sp. 03113]
MNWSLFEQSVQKRMEKDHIPGMAVAVSQNGKVIYEKGFGVADILTNEPVTTNTIFGTGSISKSFTALAIMMLEEEGKLSIDDPVKKHLPLFHLKGVKDINQIKIHHLLTHTTGLGIIERNEQLNKLSEHVNYLAEVEHEIFGQPGVYLSYGNDTFLLLGAIIEAKTGKLFRRFMTEQILNPLQMYRTSYSLEEVHKSDHVATPYKYSRENERYEKLNWPALGNYEVGGGIRTTVIDLLKYGELYINRGMANGKQMVSAKQIEKMWKPYFEMAKNSHYGYAWKVNDYHGITLVEHNGVQQGVSSNFGFIPEKNIAVAVLTNVSNVAADVIWLEVINTMLNIPLHTQRFLPVPFPIKNPKALLGTYVPKKGGRLEIIANNGELQGKINGEVYTLQLGENGSYFFNDTLMPIRFYFDQNGKAWAVFAGMRMLRKQE